MIVEIPLHVRKMMIDNIRRLTYKETDYNRLLSVGRIYHALSLVTEERPSPDTVVVCVQIFKPQYDQILKLNLIIFFFLLKICLSTETSGI